MNCFYLLGRGSTNSHRASAGVNGTFAMGLGFLNLVDFVDLLLTWGLGMQETRGEAGCRALILIRILGNRPVWLLCRLLTVRVSVHQG